MNRRRLLGAALAAAVLPPGPALRAAGAAGDPRRLVVILLRGAVDGLNIVVPCGDDAYYRARGSIAIARPGERDGALRLDGRFGLHPALGALMPLWEARQLAFVHAAGSPDPTRSHFVAQRYLETGTPGCDTTADGWMNRLLAVLPGEHAVDAAIGIGPILPRILSGKAPVANFPLGAGADRPLPTDGGPLGAAFDRLYAGSGAQDAAYRAGRAARRRLLADLAGEQRQADGGAPPPRGFPAQAARLAALLRGDPGIRLAFAALGGWDTHVRQGGATGRLASRLRPLGDGLAALARGLGALWRDTAVVVLSEFGRTLGENDDGGTDHGHGNVIWIAGGGVRGGRVYGDWPGLAPDRLYQRRDLAVTTDFRSALAAVLEAHLRLPPSRLEAVFPGLPAADAALAPIVAA